MMTQNEFHLALIGEGHYHTTDGSNRLRYIVAEAIYSRAKELQKERPGTAGVDRKDSHQQDECWLHSLSPSELFGVG
jgi:hypothetical protein